jgi:hypothetical protein
MFPVAVSSTFSAILYNCRNQRIKVTKCKRSVINFFLILRDFVLEDNLFWPGEIFVKSCCEDVKREILPSNESSRSRGFDFFSKVFKFLFCFYFPLLQIQISYFLFFTL